MILYYAVGGGLGHLTRGRRVLETLGLAKNAALVTSSPYATDTRVTGRIPVIQVPPHLEHAPEDHHTWLHDLIREQHAGRLIADAFPLGIQGELTNLPIPIDHVARILKLDEYRKATGTPASRRLNGRRPAAPPHDALADVRFGTTWIVEPLTPDHEAFLRTHSDRVQPLDLLCQPSSIATAPPDNYWLIVHSAPEDEVQELIAYTATLRDLAPTPPKRILIASRCTVPLPPGFEPTDEYPASRLFPSATRIISAAGFNVMHETEPWASKHDVVPFPRRFDDQYLRASRRRL